MRLLLPALACGLGSAPAMAEPFVLLIHEAPAQIALRDDTGAAGRAYWAAYAEFGMQAAAAGILRGGTALGSQALGHAGQARGDDALLLGGFFLIDVADAATAAAWAAKLPAAATGGVEVRAALSAPGM